jgi:DNA-binding HxlR family transcriptional regulator
MEYTWDPNRHLAATRYPGETTVPQIDQKVFTTDCAQRLLQKQPAFQADCPSRLLLNQIADKWSVLILAALNDGPLRFNALRRSVEGITQKALTQSLRRLERNGIVARQVMPRAPVAVEYAVTPLGRTLDQVFIALYGWTVEHVAEVEQARQVFDRGTKKNEST